jgi:hypothetical protein
MSTAVMHYCTNVLHVHVPLVVHEYIRGANTML